MDAEHYADFRTQWSLAEQRLPAVVHYVEHVKGNAALCEAAVVVYRHRARMAWVWSALTFLLVLAVGYAFVAVD